MKSLLKSKMNFWNFCSIMFLVRCFLFPQKTIHIFNVLLACVHNLGILKAFVCFSTDTKNTLKMKMSEPDHGTSFTSRTISGVGRYAIMFNLIALSQSRIKLLMKLM